MRTMRTHPTADPILTPVLAAALLGCTVLGQPANQPRIDPATGLPAAAAGELTPENAVNECSRTVQEVHRLIFNHQYETALQRCLAFHNKWKTSASLVPLLGDWMELGRRYPEAKNALVAIRDQDVREFSEGRAYFALFQEINSINAQFQDDNVTYDLFKSFRDKDPNLAQQCYGLIEGLLVARGDYQYCFDHMGEPQARFDSICRDFRERLERNKRLGELNKNIRQHIEEERRRRGWTNSPDSFPRFSSARQLQYHAENTFAGRTRLLIEILVATGHKAEAEKIRDQALRVMDDARLQSAVEDAIEHIRK